MAPRHLALMLLVNLVWGMSTVAIKFAVDEIPPLLATGIRFLIIAVVLLPFLRIQPGRMLQVLIVAPLAGAVQLGLFFYGLALSEGVSTSAILSQLNVPFATLMSILLLGEVVRWRRWSGIALTFVGSMVLSFDPNVFEHPLGALMVIGSSLVQAWCAIWMRRMPSMNVFHFQAWLGLLSAPPVLLLSLFLENGHAAALAHADWQHYGAVAFTAFGSSLIGHGGLFWLLQRYPVSVVSPLTLLSPFITVAFGIAFMGDEMSSRLLLGGLITFIGVLIITLRKPETAVPSLESSSELLNKTPDEGAAV